MKTIEKLTSYRGDCSCDHCGTGIKNIYAVTYIDGETYRFGSECIFKIIGAQPTLKKMIKTKIERIQQLKHWVEILEMPHDKMPRGDEYNNSGLFFVIDPQAKSKRKKAISYGSYIWHPVMDWEKNQSGQNYVEDSKQAFIDDAVIGIEKKKAEMLAEISKAENFIKTHINTSIEKEKAK